MAIRQAADEYWDISTVPTERRRVEMVGMKVADIDPIRRAIQVPRDLLVAQRREMVPTSIINPRAQPRIGQDPLAICKLDQERRIGDEFDVHFTVLLKVARRAPNGQRHPRSARPGVSAGADVRQMLQTIDYSVRCLNVVVREEGLDITSPIRLIDTKVFQR